MSRIPLDNDRNSRDAAQRFRLGLGSQILILSLVVLVVHCSGLWRGRMLDDFFILDKCKNMTVGQLLTDGLTISREEAGNVWWIEQGTILSYFRPLLLLTYKLPIEIFNRPDFWQHLINLAVHLGTVLLLLATARCLTQDAKSSFLAALFFSVSIHHLLAVQWISGRKEPLVGLFLILAFFLHLKDRRGYAALAFFGGLLTGEQAVVFPLMAFLWDILSRKQPLEGGGGLGQLIRRRWKTWALYAGVLIVYLVLRGLLFNGPGSPVSPYYASSLSSRTLLQNFLKFLLFLFSLTLSVPYVDQFVVERWINSPAFFAVSLLLTLFVALAVLGPFRSRRAPWTLLLLAVISYLPFLLLAAIPFYLYTPSLFFALAIGAGLADSVRIPRLRRRRAGRLLFVLILALMILNAGAAMILSWTSVGDFFKIPPATLYSTAGLLRKIPGDRNVLLLDVPAEYIPAFFHFNKLLAEAAGREPSSLGFLADRPGRSDPSSSLVTPLGPSGFLMQSEGRPYFNSPGGRLMWLFPEESLVQGKTFFREWYAVTIRELAPETKPFNRGRRFYSKKEGISVLEVTLKQGIPPPLVISFKNHRPFILLDLKESPYELGAPPPSPAGRADFLLRALVDKKGTPPVVLKRPDRLIPKAGPKMGLGPLLKRMAEEVPVFRRAYFSFLYYLDDWNTRLQRAGAGLFRQEASNTGAEYYARAIEAMGGMSTETVRSDHLGLSWDSLMGIARLLADESLKREDIDLGEQESRMLSDLLALAQIAAVANQVIPEDYLAEWELRHPERPRPAETAPKDIPDVYWKGVRESIPWMYHSGALPRRDGASGNPHEAFDSYHFFSHAWMVAYGLYRYRYFHSGLVKGGFARREPARWAVETELYRSRLAGLGQEILTLAVKQGFRETTKTEYLPPVIRSFCRFLRLHDFPFVESFRDMSVGQEGAVYGAALAVSGLPLKPSDRCLARKIIDDL